jgi:hypothetical protein
MEFQKELELSEALIEEAKKKKKKKKRGMYPYPFAFSPLYGRDSQGVSAAEIGSVGGVTTTAHTAASGTMGS